MQLYYSPTSPFARKVRIVARKMGLAADMAETPLNPFSEKPELVKLNPLGKVPALVIDDRSVLFDSAVICDYLSEIGADHSGSLWPPAMSPTYWEARTRAAMADGIMEAAFSLVMERKRPLEQQSLDWIENWTSIIWRSLATVSSELPGSPTLGTIDNVGIACALSYLDFRLGDLDWRAVHNALSDWHLEVEQQADMLETAPPAGM